MTLVEVAFLPPRASSALHARRNAPIRVAALRARRSMDLAPSPIQDANLAGEAQRPTSGSPPSGIRRSYRFPEGSARSNDSHRLRSGRARPVDSVPRPVGSPPHTPETGPDAPAGQAAGDPWSCGAPTLELSSDFDLCQSNSINSGYSQSQHPASLAILRCNMSEFDCL